MSSALNVPACLELPFGTALQWLEVGVLIYATLPPPTKKKRNCGLSVSKLFHGCDIYAHFFFGEQQFKAYFLWAENVSRALVIKPAAV